MCAPSWAHDGRGSSGGGRRVPSYEYALMNNMAGSQHLPLSYLQANDSEVFQVTTVVCTPLCMALRSSPGTGWPPPRRKAPPSLILLRRARVIQMKPRCIQTYSLTSLFKNPKSRMSCSTIWSRTLVPLAVLMEQGLS